MQRKIYNVCMNDDMQRTIKIYNLYIMNCALWQCEFVRWCIVNQRNRQSQIFFKDLEISSKIEGHSLFYLFCTCTFCNEFETKQCKILFRQLTSYCSSLHSAVSGKFQTGRGWRGVQEIIFDKTPGNLGLLLYPKKFQTK